MTYSLVARDPDSGALGVAVQSHFFGVGRIVGWAETGVGAIATQASAEVMFGPRGIALLREGTRPADAVARLLAEDPGAATRQLAVLAADGEGAVHTGDACCPSAGHLIAENVTAQGNMLAGDGVVGAMLDAFQGTSGDLATRLLAGLDAAEGAGGDIRGRQSAALLVVPGGERSSEWREPTIDVRVDDHPLPLPELRRLAEYNAWYTRLLAMFNEPGLFGGEAAADADAVERALEELRAGQALLGDNQEATFWLGVVLARAGRVDEARTQLQAAFAVRPELAEFLRRMGGGLFAEPDVVDRLL